MRDEAGAGQRLSTLAFRDAALEAEYARHAAAEGRTQFRVAVVIGLVLWLSVAGIDPLIGGSAANTRHIMILRAIAAALFLPAVALAWAREAWFVRAWQPGGAAAAGLLLWTVVIMNATAPDAASYGFESGVIGFCITIVAAHTLAPLRLVYAAAATLPASIAFGVVLATRSSLSPLLSPMWLGIALLAGFAGSLILEQSRRKVFLYNRLLARERARSDSLLYNLLPASIAERLRWKQETIAEACPSATVMFADIVGFTSLSERVPPGRLVATLDAMFSRFDEMAERHGLEKIKTIGDAYMVVGGVPVAHRDHVTAAAEMALEMRAFVAGQTVLDGVRLSLRIGIHTGPVVAGVIGKKRLIYDLWGDTVNTASRMESHGVADAIQVTEPVYRALRAGYELEERGAISIKGKGEMRTWLLVGRRAA